MSAFVTAAFLLIRGDLIRNDADGRVLGVAGVVAEPDEVRPMVAVVVEDANGERSVRMFEQLANVPCVWRKAR